MRLLFVVPDLPVPPTSGGRIRMRNLLHHLAARHEVDLLAVTGHADADAVEALGRLCARVEVVRRPEPSRALVARVGRALRRELFERDPAVEAELRARLAGRTYDLVQAETPYLSRYLLEADVLPASGGRRPPVVLDFFGVSLGARRELQHGWRSRRAPALLARWLAARGSERRAARGTSWLTVVCEDDRRFLASIAPRARIGVVPNGVDCRTFAPGEFVPAPGDASVVFVGDMSFVPNVDAVLHFHRTIHPVLRRTLGALTVWVVGRAPVEPIRRLADDPSFRVTGLVEDVRPYLARADVVIAPIRQGSGTRNKLLEAFAMAKPVVSTSIGAEGLEAVPGRDLLVADRPEAFAGAVASLLRDRGLARAMGESARALAVSRYDWPVCAARLDAVHDAALAESA